VMRQQAAGMRSENTTRMKHLLLTPNAPAHLPGPLKGQGR
jgi:hypothetical protein